MKENIRRVVILGHSGFLGSCLYEYLSKNANYTVKGFSSQDINLVSQEDCRKLEMIIDEETTMIMAASAMSKDKSVSALQRDEDAMLNLAALVSRTKKIRHLIYISSIAVYGHLSANPVQEGDRHCPDDLYGISKSAWENNLNLVCSGANYSNRLIDLTILRPGIICGRGDIRSPFFRFMKSIGANQDIEIYGDGSAKVYWVHKSDLCGIIKSVIDESKTGDYNIVADGNGIDLISLAETMFEISDRRVVINLKPSEKLPVNLNFDISKLKIDFPWEFKNLKEILKEY